MSTVIPKVWHAAAEQAGRFNPEGQQRDKSEYPWFWGWDEEKQDFAGAREFTGDRWNDCHYTGILRRGARK